jgi:hypothetical protein
MPDLVVDECGAHGGFIAETFSESARRVVLAAAFPSFEFPRGADATFARIEPEHNFAERDLIESD